MKFYMYFVYEIVGGRILSCGDSLRTELMIAKKMYDCGFNVRLLIADIDVSGIDFEAGVIREYKHEEEE